MKKKIVVPEGMLKAVHDRVQPHGTPMEDALQAALRWLSENPIVPTLEQVNEIMPLPTMREIIAEWQRRMFLAPEPSPIVLKVENALIGCTLTRSEADELIRYVNECTHG